MFSTGQWIFAGIFFVSFVIIVAYSYRKDKKLHQKEYKGSIWILAGFLLFIAILFGIKFMLKE